MMNFRSPLFVLLVSALPFMFANGQVAETTTPTELEKPLCPENQHWDLSRACCEKNCNNYNQDIICNKMCVQGCACNVGYVRECEGSNKCVPESMCNSCLTNTIYSSCEYLCQPSCGPKAPCLKICAPGCVCKEGYVRHNKECIPKGECPIQYS